MPLPDTSKYYGIEAAVETAELEAANVKAVTQYIQEEGVDCDFVITRAMDVFFSDQMKRRMRKWYESLIRAGVNISRDTFHVPDNAAEKKRCVCQSLQVHVMIYLRILFWFLKSSLILISRCKLSGVKGAKSVYSFTSGHLWRYKLVHHMFEKAVANGVNLQTEILVQGVSEIAKSGNQWTVHTNRGNVRAKKVIFTTNIYTSAILPEYKKKIIPYRTIACPSHGLVKPRC
jgi:glycine/D-amino acid oxidase-like deaminating enzyme